MKILIYALHRSMVEEIENQIQHLSSTHSFNCEIKTYLLLPKIQPLLSVPEAYRTDTRKTPQ